MIDLREQWKQDAGRLDELGNEVRSRRDGSCARPGAAQVVGQLLPILVGVVSPACGECGQRLSGKLGERLAIGRRGQLLLPPRLLAGALLRVVVRASAEDGQFEILDDCVGSDVPLGGEPCREQLGLRRVPADEVDLQFFGRQLDRNVDAVFAPVRLGGGTAASSGS